MIKKLQALKAKKGFTLVELIVVIAIIGVLAAILIPIMLGYVTNSRIQSVNTTAKGIRSEINGYISSREGAGDEIQQTSWNGGFGIQRLAITTTPTHDFEWTNGTLTSDFEPAGHDAVDDELSLKAALQNKMTDIKNGNATIWYADGVVLACAFSSTTISGVTYNPATNTWGGFGKFSAKNPGKTDNGTIVGTNPVFDGSNSSPSSPSSPSSS